MTMADVRGKTALITGASSGLGADCARELAARGCQLILVARREELLQRLQAELTGQHSVEVTTIPLDLTAPDAPDTLYAHVAELGKRVDVLINSAGYGLYGEFLAVPWERERNMLELDIVATVHLTKLFAKEMVGRRSGHILQIASIGAFQPSPLYASYSAAKSFILNFSEALSYELRKTGVTCTVISPGITATEFLKVSGQQATLYQRLAMMSSAKVARIAVESMLRGRRSVVPGWLNVLTALTGRFAPRPLAMALAHRMMA